MSEPLLKFEFRTFWRNGRKRPKWTERTESERRREEAARHAAERMVERPDVKKRA